MGISGREFVHRKGQLGFPSPLSHPLGAPEEEDEEEINFADGYAEPGTELAQYGPGTGELYVNIDDRETVLSLEGKDRAFGWPAGSVRAILAIMAVGAFFVTTPLMFVHDTTVALQYMTATSGIVGAATGLYFGNRERE